jgi:hypothetical protein
LECQQERQARVAERTFGIPDLRIVFVRPHGLAMKCFGDRYQVVFCVLMAFGRSLYVREKNVFDLSAAVHSDLKGAIG